MNFNIPVAGRSRLDRGGTSSGTRRVTRGFVPDAVFMRFILLNQTST
jgi:hypothetical protein